MTIELMEDFTVLLFLAGLDTVSNAIGFGIRHLAANFRLQTELRVMPARIPDVTEALLRRYTFVVPMRRVTRDIEVGGIRMKAGDIIQLFLPAGDLDATEFAKPARFDLERENKVHMAFGAGPHRCL